MQIEFKPLKNRTWRQITPAERSVKGERVRDAEGRVYTRFTVDFASDTIDDDLTYVFGRNVKRAREENKRVTGSADGVSTER